MTVCKVFLALVAMFGQTHHHFRHQRLRLGRRLLQDTGSDIERSERSRELAQLARRAVAALAFGWAGGDDGKE